MMTKDRVPFSDREYWFGVHQYESLIREEMKTLFHVNYSVTKSQIRGWLDEKHPEFSKSVPYPELYLSNLIATAKDCVRRIEQRRRAREKTCVCCLKGFTGTRSDSRYCSPACKQAAYRCRVTDAGGTRAEPRVAVTEV